MYAFLAQYPVLQTIADTAISIVPLALLFAFSGLPLISSTGEILAIRRKRSFYAKCALQLAMLSQGIGWVLLVGGRIWLYLTTEDVPPSAVLGAAREMSWLALGMAVVFNCIYFFLWKAMSKLPVLHIGIGLLNALQSLLALLLVLGTMRIDAVVRLPQVDGTVTLADVILPMLGTSYAHVVAYTPFLFLAMPAAFGCVWLLLRRKSDDYGRDHYATVLPWCARWARNAWIVLWLALLAFSGLEVYRQMQEGSFVMQDGITAGIRVLLWLIPVLLWTLTARSTTPMRHKLALVVALLLSCAFMLPFFMELTNWQPLP